MDYYFLCVCGREWFFTTEDIRERDYLYCTECGEPIPFEELIAED